MRRLGYAIALLTLLLSPASADTALPGLVRESLMLPITLPDGGQVNLEAMVVRPDRSERFPLVVLVHGTIRASGEALRTAMAQHRRPTSSVRLWRLRSVVMRPYRSCAVALAVRRDDLPKLSLERASIGIIWPSGE